MYSKPKIYLTDLRHIIGGVISNTHMPLGIAYMKAVMDRELPSVESKTFADPHQLLEGMLIACYAQGMTCAYHYLRGEFIQQFKRMEQALQEATAQGLVGRNILSSGLNISIHNVLVFRR